MSTSEESKTYNLSWKAIASGWARLGIGNHPSPHIVKAYERFLLETIAGVKNPRALLLGATPELRDMFTKHSNLAITILDLNPEMIAAMTSLMESAAAAREERVVGDWLAPPFSARSFNAIVGDQIGNNIPFAKHSALYSGVARLLAPGGSYITRLTSRFPDTVITPPEKLIAKFAAIPPSKPSITEFWNCLTFFTHTEPLTSSDRALALLKNSANPNLQEYYRQFLEILPPGKSWYIGDWEEERTKILEYFEIVNLVRDDTFFGNGTYIFHFRTKQ